MYAHTKETLCCPKANNRHDAEQEVRNTYPDADIIYKVYGWCWKVIWYIKPP